MNPLVVYVLVLTWMAPTNTATVPSTLQSGYISSAYGRTTSTIVILNNGPEDCESRRRAELGRPSNDLSMEQWRVITASGCTRVEQIPR